MHVSVMVAPIVGRFVEMEKQFSQYDPVHRNPVLGNNPVYQKTVSVSCPGLPDALTKVADDMKKAYIMNIGKQNKMFYG